MSDNLMGPSNGLIKSKLELANAIPSQVLSGQTFYSGDKTLKTGTMVNRWNWSSGISPGGSVTIPEGYHNGTGVVSAAAAASGHVLGIYAGTAPYSQAWYYINQSYNSAYMSSGNVFSTNCTVNVHIQFGHSPYLNSIIIQVAGQTLWDGEANGNHVIDRQISVWNGASIYIDRHNGSGQTSTYFLCVTTLAW